MSLQTIASPGTSGWRGPIEITWRSSVAMPSIPIHCKCMGGWFVLKSIAHGSKCPIELCLPIDVGRKFSWLMKTCSQSPLICGMQQTKAFNAMHYSCMLFTRNIFLMWCHTWHMAHMPETPRLLFPCNIVVCLWKLQCYFKLSVSSLCWTSS